MQHRGYAILAFIVALTAGPVHAFRPSQAEMATLPPYCAARFEEGSPAFATWRASMGGDFIHVHHYCAGLNFLNRSYGISSAKDRQGTLGGALRQFDYMLTHVQPGFSLRPEILLHRGITLSLLKRPGEAVANLQQAIDMNPGLARAYQALADLHLKLKDRAKALEVVTAGLRHNPGTTSLQRRYTELGGKLPYPAPLAAAPAATPAAEPVAAEAPKATEPPAAERAETDTSPQKIGVPGNPYCRFCPPE